jgi:hypothetical protein
VSIGWKLFITHLVVILVAVGTLGLYLGHEMSQRAQASLEASLLERGGHLRREQPIVIQQAMPAQSSVHPRRQPQVS